MSLPRVDKAKRLRNAKAMDSWEAVLSKKWKRGLPGPPMMWIGLWGACYKSLAVHRMKWEGTEESTYRNQLEPEVLAILLAVENITEALQAKP